MTDISSEAQEDLFSDEEISTYSILTSERILEYFHIHLAHTELIHALKNPYSLYYKLLKIPLKNVFNGIIQQQAYDYQVYAQKLFVDYLVSGEGNKAPEEPGGQTREDLETARQDLIKLGEIFTQHELDQEQLIANSQDNFIKLAREINQTLPRVEQTAKRFCTGAEVTKSTLEKAMQTLLIDVKKDSLDRNSPLWDKVEKQLGVTLNSEARHAVLDALQPFAVITQTLDDLLSQYSPQAAEMGEHLRSIRKAFYHIIIRVTELLKLLPDYRYDHEQDMENRAALYFDSEWGDQEN